MRPLKSDLVAVLLKQFPGNRKNGTPVVGNVVRAGRGSRWMTGAGRLVAYLENSNRPSGSRNSGHSSLVTV